MLPDGVGGGGVVARQVLGALAGGDDVEPAAARPLHELAGKGRLVAVGHRVHDPGPFRFEREQRTGEHVRLDVHHDDVLSGRERAARMPDARVRPPGGFHHHVHVGARRESEGVVGERGIRDEGIAPAGGAAGGLRAVRIQVGDRGDPQAGSRGSLTQEHRPELAGPDKSDPYRLRRVGLPEKVRVEVHDGEAPFQVNSCIKTVRTKAR